jgi:hypothetical protein
MISNTKVASIRLDLNMKLSITRERLKHDFKYYVDNRLFIPYTEKKYIITPKHLKCIEGVMDNNFTLIEAYRGFGKSELITYAYVLWRAEMWNESSLILSANENLANMKLDLIRNAIETDNAELHYMYSGDMNNYSWNRGEIHLIDRKNPRMAKTINPKTGFEEEIPVYNIKAKIWARSMFSISRGIHADNIIGDDIVVEQNSESLDLIIKTKNLFNESIVPIRKPGAKLIVVGTPQNEQDLLESLRKSPLFHPIIIPALDDQGKPTCPELHSLEFIRQQEILLGPKSFLQEYMLKPVVETDSDFKIDMLNNTRRFDMPMVQYYEKKPNEIVLIGADFSIKEDKIEAERKDSDYFALAAVKMNTETREKTILNLYRERGIRFVDQISFAISWCYRYNADGLCTEAHAFLDIFNQIINDIAKDIKIIDTGGTSGKFDKAKGIPSMKWEWQKGLWKVPYGDALSIELSNRLFYELQMMERADHDDLVDALFRAQKGLLQIEAPAGISYTPYQHKVQQKFDHLLRLA